MSEEGAASAPIPFDPWSSTLEEAVEAQRLPQTRPSYAQPIFQWEAASAINHAREECDAGDGYKIMFCVHLCAWHELVMPDWLAQHFMRRFRLVNHAEKGSWDEAFGRPYKKGVQLARVRFRRKNRIAIHNAVIKAIRADPSRAIDERLFEEIGREFGAGDTLAEELYREALKLGLTDAADLKRELQGKPQKPAKSKKLAGTKTHA